MLTEEIQLEAQKELEKQWQQAVSDSLEAAKQGRIPGHLHPNVFERFKDIRQVELAQLEQNIEECLHTAVRGNYRSGKTSVLQFAAKNDLGGREGVYVDLEGIALPKGSFLTVLEESRRGAGVQRDQKQTLFIDEIRLVNSIPGTTEQIVDVANSEDVVLVVGTQLPLTMVDTRLAELIQHQIELPPIPVEKRPKPADL